jgi:hypothetical protein
MAHKIMVSWLAGRCSHYPDRLMPSPEPVRDRSGRAAQRSRRDDCHWASGLSCLVQYLDSAVAAVDPDPVVGVQEHGGVAAPDDGGDAEFAGHDRGVGERRADLGYD